MQIIKRMLKQGINSFFYSMAITTIALFIVMQFNDGKPPMLPEFMAHFTSPVEAFVAQLLLIGCMSFAFGAGAVLLELERIPLIVQSILYFIVTSIVWIPIANYCWQITKYPQALFGLLSSYIASYTISWVIQYRLCKKNVDEINKRLENIRNEQAELTEQVEAATQIKKTNQ